MADELAREGTIQSTIKRAHGAGLYFATAKNMLKLAFVREVSSRWLKEIT